MVTPRIARPDDGGFILSVSSPNGLWGALEYTSQNNPSTWVRDSGLRRNSNFSIVPSGVCALSVTGSVSHGPVWCPDLTITGDVQLHNRDQLLLKLDLSRASEPLTDLDLLLAAFAKWGTQCAEHLLGEFAFAIWDDRHHRLFCCRDHLGLRAFLYWHDHARFVFAGDVSPIYKTTNSPRCLNRRKFAALAVPGAHITRHEETFHQGILSLPPGTWMLVNGRGIRQQRYWEPTLESAGPVPWRADKLFEEFREILFQAVECRLDRNRPVAAFLSGGLDSSSVVAIAARCLAKTNKGLTAISAVLPDETRAHFADERDFIGEFRSWGNIDIRFVSAPGRGPFDTLYNLSRFERMPLLTSRFFLLDECEKVVADAGAREFFWGFGGEMGATSWSERYYLEMAFRLRLPTLFRELRKRRSSDSASGFRILARQLYRMLAPNQGQMRSLYLTDHFQRECLDKPPRSHRRLTQRADQLDGVRSWIRKHAMERGQSPSYVRPSSPLLDKRVLEFCLALPPRMDVRDGYQRYPIRKALDGVLPPRLQWRTDKVAFSPDYFARYNAQLGMAREFVADIGPNDPVRAVIDVDHVSSLLKPVDPLVGSVPARDQIPVTLYSINFLRQFSDFRP